MYYVQYYVHVSAFDIMYSMYFFKTEIGRISHTCILLLQANGAC